MAKQEQREIAINFQTNVSSTIDQLRDLQSTLDKNSSEYEALSIQIEKTEQALRDYDTLLESNIATEKQVLQSKEKLQKQFTNNEKIIQKNTTATKDLTKEVTANGGAMSILDTLTGGLASQFKNAYEATGLFTKGTIASAIGMKGASVGAKALRVALATIGIGLIISAVGYLVSNWDNLKKSFTDFLPSIGLTSGAFDKVKAVIVGVGGVIINYLLAPIKAFIALVKGDFRGAVDEIMNGYNVVGNYNKAKNDQIEKDNQAHRDKEFAEEVANDERNIQRARNRGERTNKLEQDLINKKSKYYKKDSDEYKKNEIDKENFADKQLAERRKKAEADAKNRIERAKETNEKLKQLEEERIARLKELAEEEEKIIEKIRILINEAFGNTSTKLLSDNEKKIKDYYKSWADEANKLYQILDAGVIDIEGFDKSIEDLDKAYEKLIANTENSNKSLAEAIAEANTELELFEKGQYLDTEGEALSIYELNESIIAISKTIDDVNSKKAFEDTFNVKDLVEANKEIDELWKTWIDFDEQLKNTPSEEDDLGSLKGLIRKNTRDQKALLEEQAEDQIQRLQDLKLITKEEADILRESSEARMDLIDQMSEAELEAYNKERELRTQKLLDNGYALQLEKYFANMSYEIQLEQTKKLEELEERRLDKKRANQEAEEAILNAVANSQAAHLDMALSFMTEREAAEAKATIEYKTLAIATATMDTYAAAISGYRSAMAMFSANPIVGNIVGIASIATAISTGIAQINAIRKVKVPGGGSGGGGSISAAGATPNVSFVSSSENQIANSVNANTNAQNQEPIKAYVVTGDINTSQSLERNKIESNSI